jgi:hypothetical protein
MTMRVSVFMRSLLLRGLGAALLAHVLLIYVQPSPAGLLAIAAVAAGSLLIDHRKTLAMTISLVVVTLVLEGLMRLGGFGLTPYYRPHEMLALDTSYRPNRSVDMTVPHGDLLTIDPSLSETLATPRREVFVTDSFGYRNEDNYDGHQLVVIGDSFVVGTESTVTTEIQRRHGLRAYNLAFSSIGPLIYTDKVEWARRNLGSDVCIALFYFEGNDFQLVDARELAARDAVPRGVQRLVKGYVQAVRGSSEWAKVFYGLFTRARMNMTQSREVEPAEREPITFVRHVGGRPMAFLRGYANVVHRESFDDHDFIRSRMAAAPPNVIYFIPDKYRVYAPLFDDAPVLDLPNAQWSYLERAAAELRIPAIDLTPAMQQRSKELKSAGEFTFWPDDTHWNEHGEAVAADVLVESLRASSDAACAAAVREAGPEVAAGR